MATAQWMSSSVDCAQHMEEVDMLRCAAHGRSGHDHLVCGYLYPIGCGYFGCNLSLMALAECNLVVRSMDTELM